MGNERSVTHMNQLRAYRSIVLAALLLIVGQVLSMPLSVSASSGAPPTVPALIAVPPGSVLLFSSHARGGQKYECKNGQWALHAPQAVLFDPQSYQRTGIHYGGIDQNRTPGPWWE